MEVAMAAEAWVVVEAVMEGQERAMVVKVVVERAVEDWVEEAMGRVSVVAEAMAKAPWVVVEKKVEALVEEMAKA